MQRLYVKFALGILICVSLSFLCIIFIVRPLLDMQVNTKFLIRTAQATASIVDYLDSQPATVNEAQMLEELSHIVNYPLSLVEASEVAAELKPLKGHRRVFYSGTLQSLHDPTASLYTEIDGGSRYLIQGPLHLPYSPEERVNALLWWIPSIFVAIIVLGGSALLVLPLMRRLRRLDQGIRALYSERFQTRLEVDSADAIGKLAASFNDMAARTNQLFRERDELMQAVSHELGTPLSRMRLHIELLRQNQDDRTRKRHLSALEEEMGELDELTSELANWIEADAVADRTSRTEARRVLEQSVAYCQELYDIEVELTALASEDCPHQESKSKRGDWLYADQRLFQRAIDNILRNASRFARTRIVVSVMRTDNRLCIAVCDDGPGVPEEHRQRIFEPFTRVDGSRSRENGGLGLGLAIVKRIIDRYDGHVEVRDAPGGGAMFLTYWRLTPATSDEDRSFALPRRYPRSIV